jgi:hypothetical protein
MSKISYQNGINMSTTKQETSHENPQYLIPKILINTERSKFWVVENYTQNIYQDLCQLQLLEEPPIMIMGKQCNQRRNIGFFLR